MNMKSQNTCGYTSKDMPSIRCYRMTIAADRVKTSLPRPGAWLPADHRVHREFLKRTAQHADQNPRRLTPALEEFRNLIEMTPRVYMYFVSMFNEIPNRNPYWKDPVGTKQIRDYHHMLNILNHIVTRAPEWTDAAESVGVVGVPMCAIFDYPMGTPRFVTYTDSSIPQGARGMNAY